MKTFACIMLLAAVADTFAFHLPTIFVSPARTSAAVDRLSGINNERRLPTLYASPCPTLYTVGLDDRDHAAVLSALHDVGEALGFSDSCSENSKSLGAEPLTYLPGALGRMCVITGCEGYEEDMEMMLAQNLDIELASGRLSGPCLAYFQEDDLLPDGEDGPWEAVHLEAALMHVVSEYSLFAPMSALSPSPPQVQESAGANRVAEKDTESMVKPHADLKATAHVLLDGDQDVLDNRFDVSSVAVFDDLVEDPLRGELLKLLARPEGEWDPEKAPDPAVWKLSALTDIPVVDDDNLTPGSLPDKTSNGVGLCGETLEFLCASPPMSGAIAAVERLFSERLFPDYHVCRMPDAVLGDTVTPLTANAPRFGDTFAYHIDACPNATPHGPWFDCFGHYRNRSPGKPRFVSVLVYLNERWLPEWGAATVCLDPPTAGTLHVQPSPGRVVVMDQDVSHKVTAPTEAAGGRPRYSLVWKLVLHAKENQAAGTSSFGSEWGTPTEFGSASRSQTGTNNGKAPRIVVPGNK